MPNISTILAFIKAKLIFLKSVLLATTAPFIGLSLFSILFYITIVAVAALVLYVLAKAAIQITNLIKFVMQNEKKEQPVKETIFTKNDALEAINKDVSKLKFVKQDIEGYRDVVIVAVKKNGLALQFVSDDLKEDQEIVLIAVAKNGMALQFAAPELKADLKVVKAATDKTPQAIKFIGPNIENYRQIVLTAVAKDGMSLEFASPELKADQEVVEAATKKTPQAIRFIDPNVENYRQIVLTAVAKDGMSLQHVSDTLKADKDVVIPAVQDTGYALMYASIELINDKEVVLTAVSHDKPECKPEESMLKHASQELQNDEDFRKDIEEFKRAKSSHDYVTTLWNISKPNNPHLPLLIGVGETGNILLRVLSLDNPDCRNQIDFDHQISTNISNLRTHSSNDRSKILDQAKSKPYLVAALANSLLFAIELARKTEAQNQQSDIIECRIGISNYYLNIDMPLLKQLSSQEGVISFVNEKTGITQAPSKRKDIENGYSPARSSSLISQTPTISVRQQTTVPDTTRRLGEESHNTL